LRRTDTGAHSLSKWHADETVTDVTQATSS